MLKFASVPAVVLCSARHGGLGIVRSLGRLGVPVYPVHRERTNPTFLSRYCRERILWDIDTAAPERSLRFLEDLSVRIGRRAILIATNDIGTMLIADHSDELAQWFVFPNQDRDLVRALCSKKHMYFLAKKWNVPTPEAAFPRSRADIEHYLKSAQFPLLLKSI